VKIKYANLFLLAGVSCFVIATVVRILGRLDAPLNYILPAFGLILIGVGAAGRRHSSTKEL